jgi:hypothetical protein
VRRVVGFKRIVTQQPIYKVEQVATPQPMPQSSPCCAPAPQPTVTNVPVVTHVQPVVVVDAPRVEYRPAPVVQLPREAPPCPPQVRYVPRTPCCGQPQQAQRQQQQVVLAAKTDEGRTNNPVGSAPKTAHECMQTINGVQVKGHCW